MTEKRVQFSNIVNNQLPAYVKEEFPLISEFLSQYYISQEFKGASFDLIQNIDQYIKVDEITNTTDYVTLSTDITDIDTTISVDLGLNGEGTLNFPKSYGLLQIDDEIITYTGVTENSFTGCIRGFSGITSYTTQNIPDQLTFISTESTSHFTGAKIVNLSSLFLKEFLTKIKYQLSPGFEERSLYSDLNQSIFLKQIKDFYQSKGTDESFKILFKVLYGKDVDIIRPKENLFRPSDSHYRLTNDIVVESISGDPSNLVNQTLYQNNYGSISYARSPITYIEKIISGIGHTYYKFSLDAGYDRDVIANGATIGKFTVHPRTKIIGPVSVGATVFDVDSTVGFPLSGELLVNYGDQTTGVVTYSSKSLTQFFECSGVSKTILDTASVGINTYAEAFAPDGSLVKLRVTSVLNSTEILGNTRYHYKNDTSVIRTLGVNSNDVYSKDWFFNIPISYEIKSITSRGTNDTYDVTTKIPNILKIGDKVDIISSSGLKKTSTIIDIISNSIFTIRGQGILNLSDTYTLQKSILKASSDYFPSVLTINSNVQNAYKLENKTLISSPSIPTYYNQVLSTTDRSITFSGSFSGSVFTITPNLDHGFYTGDVVYYSAGETDQNFLFDEGIYFVKRIDENNISLAKSRANIFNNIFVSVSSSITVTNHKIELYDFKFKTLTSQKLLREISPAINDGNTYTTNPGFTGMLLNGVEILNYKASESIYYGEIKEIEVTAPGLNYDVINPPILSITDSLGIGATGFCAINGSLQEIRIIDSGFDYLDTPIIKITGGNGIGAKASVNMKLIEHESSFNSQDNADLVGIGSTSSTIGFTTYHKFRNAEKIIYKTDGQMGIGGISTDSSYFVSVVDNFTVKLHKTSDDAISGINTVTLSTYGIGIHKLRSYNQKSVVGSINVENSGFGYENKKRSVTHSGINTSLSQIEINNHGYNSGEKVTYTTDFTPISGLTTNTEYIVTKINDNAFRLSAVGFGSTENDFYYQTKQYIKFNSVGVGTHIFNYPEIKVELIGNVGLSSIGTKTFNAILQPIFRGEITSVHLTSGGVGYGSSEIINFYRQPSFTLKSGKSAQLNPIVSTDGKIIEVLVDSVGSEYNSPPTLIVSGTGTGAVVTPVISNGQLISVKVIENGIGYSQNSTSITVIPAGSSAEFNANIQSWTINLFKKYYSSLTSDDGIVSEGLNDSFGLQYSHLYAPRKLREILQPSDQNGNKVYGKTDLSKQNNIEINSTSHSPIIGWAYDGNPIYGPYGYITKTGGIITQLKSGYISENKLNRPPLTLFELGFFVEDFTHYKKDDDTILDENNGRFCVTPEFPKGTYAYFATLELFADSSGKFINYKQPKFPYLIGNSFNSKPIDFNFVKNSNQDDIDLNETKWSRNTYFYNLINENSSYAYLTVPNKLNQTFDVKFASPGSVESVGIVTGGENYKVDDAILFDNTNTQGYNLSARVSKIAGRSVSSVSVATSTISNVEIYPGENKGDYLIISDSPHNFKNNDFVSVYGLSTTSSLIEGFYKVGVSTNILTISGIGTTSGTVTTGIGSTGITGIITYINVSGNLRYPNIKENDTLSIENEKVKVLNVDELNSRVRVIRSYQGTTGSAHTSSTQLKEDSRKLIVNAGYRSSYDYRINTQLYFNPIDSVGLGTLSGVGIGTTIIFSNPGAGITQIFIPTKSIYIPNHGLETGDIVTYSNNGGSSLVVSVTGIGTTSIADQSSVYIAKISEDLIGIATVRVGLGSTGTFVGIASTQRSESTLYFVELGSGVYHSLKTNFDVITGTIEKNLVTVSCASTHGLYNNDTVYIDVNPSISTTFILKYDDYNRKVGINPKSFISAGVNTTTNTINIINHQLYNGQKIIHTSSSPCGGLQSEKEYYIIRVDKNNIKLSDSFYNATIAKPVSVGITSSSFGTILQINPSVTLYKDSSVTFDLSDSSLSYINQSQRYSAFSLDFYKDSNFTQIFESSGENALFEVQKFGAVGISSDAKVILTVNENIPNKLYYKLTPIYDNNTPEEKKNINIDYDVILNNEIEILESKYNGKHTITSISSTSFTYTLPETPENISYIGTSSSIRYNTDSVNAFGPVSEVEITNKGRNYYALPGISTISSKFGKNALLDLQSSTIGKIQKTKINDIGFDFPSDFTLRPSISLNQIIKVEPLSSFKSVGVASVGRGYTTSPKLLVFDGKTNNLVPEVDLKYTLGNNKVEILKNAYSLNNVTPTILPIQNSNGVGIGSIRYNSTLKEVTVTLSVGFSTADSFPFEVNDKVMIENVSVGIGSTGIGYNSENYNYNLFTLTSITENRGGIGSVTYSLNGLLTDSQVPGNYDPINSSGRIIPQKYFPIFNIELEKNNYLIGENIKSSSAEGYVDGWNPTTNQLRAVSKENFIVGEIIEGLTSKSQGIASIIDVSDSFFNLDSSSIVDNGWQTSAGFLNTNSERIQDSDFYQNFSYSIKSEISYDSWKDAVSTLNHTTGFKKFSEYQLETTNSNSMSVGLSTEKTSIDVVADIVGFGNLNCVSDFDLVRENSLLSSGKYFSNEITFSSRILTDYFESVGNRVLSVDDLSSQFNSNPRSTRFSEVHRFLLTDARAQKYITYVSDRRYTGQRQLMLVSLIHDGGLGYLNQYARLESTYDLGSFDFTVDGSEGVLTFNPINYSVNDYNITTLSYNLKDSMLGIGTSNFGDLITVKTSSQFVSSGSTTIIGVGTTYNSAKVLVEITGPNNQYEFDELNIVHDGTNIELLEYGQVTDHSLDAYSSSGLGTYHPYISGSELKVDFYPNTGIAVTVNTFQTLLGGVSSGIGTYDMQHARLQGISTSITSSGSPVATPIIEYPGDYDCSYCLVQVSDTTNNRYQLSEIVILDDQTDENVGETYIVEFGNVETYSGLGTFGVQKSGLITQLMFTPLPSINTRIVGFFNALRHQDDEKDIVSFNNGSIETNYGTYFGTERDIKRAFDLKHKGDKIFRREFDGSDVSIANTSSDAISIPNHFFVTGEEVIYSNPGTGSTQAIGIGSTDFGVGIGTTDKLPSNIYIVKINENTIKLARNAEDALSLTPKVLDITSVGIGTSHAFTSINQNAKVIVAIDNLIQSPIVSTAQTTTLAINAFSTDDLIYVSGITSFFGGDLIKIGEEIMRIDSVGVGSTNAFRVRRPWLGTSVAGYSTGSLVTKVVGNYNVVDNTLNFSEAPYGNVPVSNPTGDPDERDWLGITTSSRFQGRTFLRSGVPASTNETYYRNYVFNDLSEQFNGKTKNFNLKSNDTNVIGISTENAVILINDIFQGPGLTNDYYLSESLGITTITFTGTATSIAYDVNTASIPSGGVIVSVGSTEGFGYQPLISAGGTAIVSGLGTISSISIGNSGSGYRSGLQTVRVGVATSTTGIPSIQFIGTAIVNNGNIVSVAITNPGSGYTSTQPPYVIIDDPLSYSNIPLIYSSSSTSGLGSQATIDVIVGQGSSIIDFEIRNLGYGYGQGEILTVSIGGTVGIPTDPSKTFREFQITVQNTISDKFTGWSIGELQVIDSIENLFDDNRVTFPIRVSGSLISIRSARGSNINIQDNLLIFLNDVLQVPGDGYQFTGGSVITFTEAPKIGDTCKILFYRGSGAIDVTERNILETVKIGDDLTIGYDASVGQSSILQEDERTVSSVDSTDLVKTLPYYGPGLANNSTLVRPVTWCRQTEDRIINEKEIGKDRILYEALIYPSSYLIQSVGIGSTIAYVDSIRPFFNPLNENDVSLTFQKDILILSQDNKVSASATAVVSSAGTISSIVISDGGFGYSSAPTVTIENSVGFGSTATATSSITAGIVTTISITGPGTGYTTTNIPNILISPPPFSIEENNVISYSGDFGIISGISTTSVGIASTGIIFDFVIPSDSPLRNSSITGFTTISGITTGYYFIIHNSNVGKGVTSLGTNGSVIGIGTTFLDNVYQAVAVSIAQTSVIGLGVTYVAKVTVSLTSYNGLSGIGFSNFYGEYSWGRIILGDRKKESSYNAYTFNGYVGISTSTIIRRSSPLKYLNYIS
jgi:hypothetical protein